MLPLVKPNSIKACDPTASPTPRPPGEMGRLLATITSGTTSTCPTEAVIPSAAAAKMYDAIAAPLHRPLKSHMPANFLHDNR